RIALPPALSRVASAWSTGRGVCRTPFCIAGHGAPRRGTRRGAPDPAIQSNALAGKRKARHRVNGNRGRKGKRGRVDAVEWATPGGQGARSKHFDFNSRSWFGVVGSMVETRMIREFGGQQRRSRKRESLDVNAATDTAKPPAVLLASGFAFVHKPRLPSP